MRNLFSITFGFTLAFLVMQPAIAQKPENAGSQAGQLKPSQNQENLQTNDPALQTALQELYSVISGPAGQKRDWDKFRAMFAPDAQMGMLYKSKQGDAAFKRITPEEYISSSGKYLEEKGFFEKSIHNQVEHFGQLVHVWSTYEAREKETDLKPLLRGINSIQFVRIGQQYKVSSIIWQHESESAPLPPHYLPVR